MLKKILNISLYLEKIVVIFGKIGAWLALPLIFIIIFDVITRRFFILGSTKLQEMEWHLHSALFLMALGYAYIRNAHVRIEIVREKYSPLIKSIFEILGILLFLIPYTILVIYYGLDFVSRSFNMNEVSSALTGLSHRWIIKSFIPVGMIILFIAGISILLKNIVFVLAKLLNKNDIISIILDHGIKIKKTSIQEKN